MNKKLKTTQEIDEWAAKNAEMKVEITHNIMQEIADTIAPEMCGYALVRIGAYQGRIEKMVDLEKLRDLAFPGTGSKDILNQRGSLMKDAADEIERLRDALAEVEITALDEATALIASNALRADKVFRECESCAAKLGSPVLCPDCLSGRAEFEAQM